jgi:hypothetical protein
MRLGAINFTQSNPVGIRRLTAKYGRLTFISLSMVGSTDWSPSFISPANLKIKLTGGSIRPRNPKD